MALATPTTTPATPVDPALARIQARIAERTACVCNNEAVPCDDCAHVFAELHAYQAAQQQARDRAEAIAALNQRNPELARTVRALDRGMRNGLRGVPVNRWREEDH